MDEGRVCREDREETGRLKSSWSEFIDADEFEEEK